MLRTQLLASLVALSLVGCGDPPPEPPVLVFAAASLAEAAVEAGELFARRHRGEVEFSFAGSTTLARQIERGAPADLFLSSHPEPVEALDRAGLVVRSAPWLENRLVVVAPAGARPLAGPREIVGFERLAVADPAAAPAGRYARDWLERIGVWHQLEGSPGRVVATRDVRAALAAVATGQVGAGLVYATDARTAGDRVTVVYRVPKGELPPVRYVMALIEGTSSRAAELFGFLRSDRTAEILRRHGFDPLGSSPTATGAVDG